MYFHQYLMLVVQISMPVEEVSSDPELPAPRIGAYLNDTKQFFLFVENNILCQVSAVSHALFLLFSSYYVFYLEYPNPVKNVMYFQDYVFNYPDSYSRSASYLAVASDIKRNM